jgi:hypothetical protein
MYTEKILKFIEDLTKSRAVELGSYIDNESLTNSALSEVEKYISYNFNIFQRIEPVYMFFIVRENSVIMSGVPLSFNDEKSKEDSLSLVRTLVEVLHLHLGVIISESWMSYKHDGKEIVYPVSKDPEKIEVITAAFSGVSRKLLIYRMKQGEDRKYLEKMNIDSLDKYEGRLAMNIANLN